MEERTQYSAGLVLLLVACSLTYSCRFSHRNQYRLQLQSSFYGSGVIAFARLHAPHSDEGSIYLRSRRSHSLFVPRCFEQASRSLSRHQATPPCLSKLIFFFFQPFSLLLFFHSFLCNFNLPVDLPFRIISLPSCYQHDLLVSPAGSFHGSPHVDS
ncbi:uncharacterized protein BO87DRAFT_167359 [Aspergillus neoniger CBS 115656]|uniref:Uncharacterized protein n=1 Tax=Aspergillus neoniger (strain CBS 115656) TaxID=1448310 RepID=A0A318YV96_ASPNB|nr:hypothetical protein BO87DRAFT_167359 [Aspergillus neoniger CBS 115656]PYH38406.1 hypothetical protein BO87DRAFT_167359 [Aspergillus neoniger CBS 115656]